MGMKDPNHRFCIRHILGEKKEYKTHFVTPNDVFR